MRNSRSNCRNNSKYKANMSLKRKLLYLIIMFAIAGMVIALSGELVVRLFSPQKVYSKLHQLVGNYYAPGECNTFTLKKNYRGSQPSMEFPGKQVTTTTNSLGLRGKEISKVKLPGTKRILILGDSYTFGAYVGDEESYPAVLERILNGLGYRTEVINAGYADGHEADDIYCWLVNRGLAFKPDIIVYGLFAGNDVSGILSPDWVSRDRRGLPDKIDHKGLFVDEFGFLRTTVKDYRSVGWQDIYRVPFLRESHLAVFLFNRYLAVISPGPPSWHIDFFPHRFKRNDPQFAEKENIFLRLMEGMNEAAHENGAAFLTIMIPMNWEVEPDFFFPIVFAEDISRGVKPVMVRDFYGDLKPKLDARNIPYIDILAKMQQHPEQKYFPRNGEVHFNPTGHLFTANALSYYLVEHQWVKH